MLDELGLQMTEGLGELPSTGSTLASTAVTNKAKPVALGGGGGGGGAAAGGGGGDAGDDDIQARLDNLRRE